MNIISDALYASIFWFPFVLTVGITYKYLKVTDISMDGVAIISGIVTIISWNEFQSITLSILLGVLSAIVGSTVFSVLIRIFSINYFISGTILSLFLNSLSVIIIGESLPVKGGFIDSRSLLFTSVFIISITTMLSYFFFRTKIGTIIRAVSDNDKIIINHNPNIVLIAGHAFSGIVLGISSSLYVHWEGIARSSSGFDFLLTAFTSLLASITITKLIKEKIENYRQNIDLSILDSMLFQVAFGTIFFQLIIYSIIYVSPYPTAWKLALSLFLLLAIAKNPKISLHNESIISDIKNKDQKSLIVKDLRKSFLVGKDELTVLNNVNLKFVNGITVITGKNGSGKSTLLKCISGEYPPTHGVILANNKDITCLPEYKRPIYRLKQDPKENLANDLLVYENIALSHTKEGNIFSIIKDCAVKKSMDSSIGNNSILNKIFFSKTSTISGGEAQYLSFYMSMQSGKNIIMADEPTNNLDFKNQETIIKTLQLIGKENIVIVVTHDKNIINIADFILKVEQGTVEYVKNA